MPIFPRNTILSPQDLRKIYDNGFQGSPISPHQKEQCFMDGIVMTHDSMAHLVEQNPGNGKRVCLWRSREKFDLGAFGEESQTTGDCVSHGDRSTRDIVRCVEIAIKGEAETYFKRGATEPTYGARGHSDEGMDPYRAARFVTENGWLVRQNYPGIVDLSTYNSNLGTRWGGRGVPENIKGLCKEHPVGNYVTADDSDEAMALFNNGYSCHSGQNVGFDEKTNISGINERKGNWMHDMATVGYDDTKDIWPVRVYFIVNSWGAWNLQWGKWIEDQELQKILGPPIDGMIVCHQGVWERYFMQDSLFYGDIKGFPTKTLPDYGTGDFL